MLFDSWEVRIVNNCDLQQHFFQDVVHSFSLYGWTLSRQITFFIFPCGELAYVPSTNHGKKSLNERATRILSDTVLNSNRLISHHFMLVASSSPIKFSKVVFLVWNFVQTLKWYYKTISINRKRYESLEIGLLHRKLSVRNTIKYSNDQRG